MVIHGGKDNPRSYQKRNHIKGEITQRDISEPQTYRPDHKITHVNEDGF